MTHTTLWLHVGEARHGVQRFGRVLASTRPRGPSTRELLLPDPSDPGARSALEPTGSSRRPDAVVVQFTDRQWGADPEQAVEAFAAVADAVGPARLVVGLHDLPRRHEPRRRVAYVAVARRADRVVVCSEHERRRLGDLVSTPVVVIPHPVERRRLHGDLPDLAAGEVAVLGYVYPGKGHADVLEAAARAAARPPLVVLGGAAPGHDDLVAELTDRAGSLGVELRVSGWLCDDALIDRAQRAAVPVVPNCAPSASGSLATWLAAGRRPLVRDSEYAREVAELAPGSIQLYPGDDPDALGAWLDEALARPGSTVGPGVPDSLRPEAVARRWAQLAEEAS